MRRRQSLLLLFGLAAAEPQAIVDYLRRVYPTTPWTNATAMRYWDEIIDIIYARGAPAHGRVMSPATHDCADGWFLGELARVDRLPPPTRPRDCVRSLFAAAPRRSRTFLEVSRWAYDGKERVGPVTSWRDYFDSGPGVWFSVQRGTGIFYDAGLTLSAPYKNAMAVALLEEAARRNVAAPCRAARLRCDGGNATRWLEAVRRTGRAACEPWLKCRDRFVLPDHYDGFLVELGRKLGYDSLHFTASPLAPLGTAYVSEVVDLRAPPGARHRTPDELAELWRALLPRRLSLRDPNDVGDEAAAATCALPPLPTLRLACAGHVSESASAEPNRQNACRRR